MGDLTLTIFYTYILKSLNSKAITYVGYTKNLKSRIKHHNKGKGAKFTRGRKWKLVYKEKFNTQKEAMSREYCIKKNRKLRKELLKKNL